MLSQGPASDRSWRLSPSWSVPIWDIVKQRRASGRFSEKGVFHTGLALPGKTVAGKTRCRNSGERVACGLWVGVPRSRGEVLGESRGVLGGHGAVVEGSPVGSWAGVLKSWRALGSHGREFWGVQQSTAIRRFPGTPRASFFAVLDTSTITIQRIHTLSPTGRNGSGNRLTYFLTRFSCLVVVKSSNVRGCRRYSREGCGFPCPSLTIGFPDSHTV